MLLWIFARSFTIFVTSRIVGGLTEGNVQMSIAMISDLTTPETRSKSLAFVGLAFAFGFTIGPPLGAYLAQFNLIELFPSLSALPLYEYSMPALFAFALILIETGFLIACLPETSTFINGKNREESYTEVPDIAFLPKASVSVGESTPTRRSTRLKAKAESIPKQSFPLQKSKQDSTAKAISSTTLSLIHFLFIFVFSGMEFTLTFLTFDRFGFSHGAQGQLLGFIGLSSALIQGLYVRKFSRVYFHERTIAMQGILACGAGLLINGLFASHVVILYLGCFCLAFTSGTVVNSLTALASMGRDHSTLGQRLGVFRSFGQLGRSLGPLVFCSLYWILGSRIVYASAGVYMMALGTILSLL